MVVCYLYNQNIQCYNLNHVNLIDKKYSLKISIPLFLGSFFSTG